MPLTERKTTRFKGRFKMNFHDKHVNAKRSTQRSSVQIAFWLNDKKKLNFKFVT
jgi:hypothetical protein